MKQKKPKTVTRSLSRPQGTAVLGRVIPELAFCGCFGVTDQEAMFMANAIAKTILKHFQMDLLQDSGLLGTGEENF